MFNFMPGEVLVDYAGPIGPDRVLKACSQCGQVAFRVLHLQSESAQREVPLCGAHFKEACARYPEIRRAAGTRVAG